MPASSAVAHRLFEPHPSVDFRFFSLPAFMGLVGHAAPLLAQPGVLPRHKGGRATDYWSLRARVSRSLQSGWCSGQVAPASASREPGGGGDVIWAEMDRWEGDSDFHLHICTSHES